MKFFIEKCIHAPTLPYNWSYMLCLHTICKLINYKDNFWHAPLKPSDNVDTVRSCYLALCQEQRQKVLNKLLNFREEFQQKSDVKRCAVIDYLIEDLTNAPSRSVLANEENTHSKLPWFGL